jgi:hypothetical protein
MEFISFGYLYGCIEQFLDASSKLLTTVATVDQKVNNRRQAIFVLLSHTERTSPVSHIGSSDQDSMWQTEGIDVNMTLNARDFLPGIIALLFGGVSVLDALSISNAEAWLRLLAMGDAGLAN